MILILLSLTVVFGADQLLKIPGQASPLLHQDPLKPLWGETLAKNDLSSFHCSGGIAGSLPMFRNNAFTTSGFPGENLKGVVLTTNNVLGLPIGSVCIDQTSMDLSTGAAKVIDLWNDLGWNNSVSGVFPSQVFFFLTRNATAPSQIPDYIPNADPNVALVGLTGINPGGANTLATFVYMQRDPTISIQSDDHGCSNTSGSVFFCGGTETITPQGWQLSTTASYGTFLQLNYTGSSATVSASLVHYINYGPGANGGSGGCIAAATCNVYSLPWFNLQSQKYYWGLAVRGASSACPCNNPVFQAAFDPQVVGNEAVPTNSGGIEIEQYNPPTISPALDTGGFFGPVIKAFISIGVFILNAVLQFVAFIAPGVKSAIIFLETLVQNVLNSIGNAIGWGNLGDDLFNFINSIIQFLTGAGCSNPCGLPAFFTNFPTLFTAFINANIVYFQWIVFPLWFASNLLTFAVNAIPQAILYMNLFVNLLATGWSFYLIMSFMIYTGDDALGGLLAWIESAQWLAIGTLHWVAIGINYALDFIVLIISLIPKPIIQMNAGKVPRLPVIDTSARFITPTFDLGELRSGNMFSAFLWLAGFNFVIWYESRNPALPGAIGAILPSTQSIMMNTGFMLGLLNLMLIVTGAWCMFWVVMRPIHLLGMDLGMFEGFGVGPGRKISSGPKGVHVSRGSKKLFQGGVQKKAAAQSYFKEQGHIEKGVGTSGAVATGALFT